MEKPYFVHREKEIKWYGNHIIEHKCITDGIEELMILLVRIKCDRCNHDGWKNYHIEVAANYRKHIIVKKVLDRCYKVTFDAVDRFREIGFVLHAFFNGHLHLVKHKNH
ncbi:hypothetical protein D3C86_1548220 [compost metagenome]